MIYSDSWFGWEWPPLAIGNGSFCFRKSSQDSGIGEEQGCLDRAKDYSPASESMPGSCQKIDRNPKSDFQKSAVMAQSIDRQQCSSF
jgi:hypothetical protein